MGAPLQRVAPAKMPSGDRALHSPGHATHQTAQEVKLSFAAEEASRSWATAAATSGGRLRIASAAVTRCPGAAHPRAAGGTHIASSAAKQADAQPVAYMMTARGTHLFSAPPQCSSLRNPICHLHFRVHATQHHDGEGREGHIRCVCFGCLPWPSPPSRLTPSTLLAFPTGLQGAAAESAAGTTQGAAAEQQQQKQQQGSGQARGVMQAHVVQGC